MNADELIERTIKLLNESRECCQAANPYLTDEESEDFAKDYQYYESLLSILSRSRIRDTATEPPTRKDGDECGCVLAKRSDLPYGKWGVAHRNDVRVNTNLYVQWTQLPEVPHDNT